jgi:hypothetical protein
VIGDVAGHAGAIAFVAAGDAFEVLLSSGGVNDAELRFASASADCRARTGARLIW